MKVWNEVCFDKYMGLFVPALNEPCSCLPMGRDLGPNPARYNGPCRPGTKLFRAVSCLGRVFFPCFGPAHQARPKCTPIPIRTKTLRFTQHTTQVCIRAGRRQAHAQYTTDGARARLSLRRNTRRGSCPPAGAGTRAGRRRCGRRRSRTAPRRRG
jgi:hypothetical protein